MLLRILTILSMLLVSAPLAATIAHAKSFAVAPFAVHGPEKYRYLSQGIQSMLVTRLSQPGTMDAADSAKVRQALPGAVDSASRAAEGLRALGVDYMVWGSTTIVGDDASLDVHVAGANGEAFATKESTPISGLIPSLERVAGQINNSLVKRAAGTTSGAAAAGAASAGAAATAAAGDATAKGASAVPANPYLVSADSRERGSAVNPNFRQEPGAMGEEQGRWRSRSLPYLVQFMTLADVDGDKQNDIILSEAKVVHWFKRQGEDIVEMGSLELPLRFQVFHISAYDWDSDGKAELFLSGWRDDAPEYVVVGVKDGKLTMLSEGSRMHINARRLPPDMRPMLLAQRKSPTGVFDIGNIYRAHRTTQGVDLGGRLSLPKTANLFNFAWLPSRDGMRLAVLGKGERITVYNDKGDELGDTEESFNGTSIGVEVDDATLPGLGQQRKAKREDFSQYFPMPLVSLDLYGNGEYVLLANRNISVAAQFFDRYRTFSQGEIQCLKWDGVSLKMLWKTETIRGQVVGYDVADIDGDGVKELVVAVNTYTGTFGTDGRTVLTAYSLNVGQQRKGN